MFSTCIKITFCLLFITFLLSNCATTKGLESTPWFSKKGIREWNQMKPERFENSLVLLDSVVTSIAKSYYSSLKEASAVALMVHEFGNIVASWHLEELDGKQSKIPQFFQNNYNFAYYNRDLKMTLICLGFYHYLRNEEFFLHKAQDSLINRYQSSDTRTAFGQLNSVLLRNDRYGFLNTLRFDEAQLGDTVSGIFQVEPKSRFRQYQWCEYEGKIVLKESLTTNLSIKIVSVDCPTTPISISGVAYSIGDTIKESALELRNITREKSRK